MGSCFSDAMGQRFAECGFDVLSNPFGTLYNPQSIAECLKRSMAQTPLTADDIIFHNGLWHSWLHHGSFSNQYRLAMLARCNESIHRTGQRLAVSEARGSAPLSAGKEVKFSNLPTFQPSNLSNPSNLPFPHSNTQAPKQSHTLTLLFTFGTAYVFRHDGRVVANCHKLPAQQFQRSRLSVDDIVTLWRPLLELFRQQGHLTILTVSPIRHLADGAHGNQLSKATLLLAVEQLCNDGLAEYFPAYEILLDELRDYRFYADDMCHPSALAERIVWQRFQQTYMSPETLALCDKHRQLTRLRQHRPLHPGTPEHEKYQAALATLEAQCSPRNEPPEVLSNPVG